jgi:hypothetical protein
MRTRTIAMWLASMALVAGAHGAPIDTKAGGNASAPNDADLDAADPAAAESGELRLTSLVPVDSIPALGRLHSWSVVDDETLIIWAGPSRPYLIELFRPSPELRFALSIGVTSFGSRIHARFDSVEVDGFSYPIRRIYQMSRNEAEALKATS